MSGNIWMYSYDIDEQDIDMLQRDFITFKQGAEYYKMGMKPFIRICRESGAVYKIGKIGRLFTAQSLPSFLRKPSPMQI